VGNRLRKTGQLSDSQYDDANALIEDAEYTYTYDNNGNMIEKVNKTTSEVTQYMYDAENRLIQITKPSLTASYKYDALGRRIEKSVNGEITRYVYDGVRILEEYNGSNVFLTRYVYGPGIDDPLLMGRGFRQYYMKDGLGSTMEFTGTSGELFQSYVYDSFGNIVLQNGTIINPFTYTAREFDAESGLYYYRARYYDPTIGRFLTEDPIGFNGGINLYTYVGNNPTNFVDPLGLQEMFPLDPNIPFPYIPLPDSGGCFGTLAFYSFSWDSSQPDITTFSLNGATLGGGLTFCYKIKCDNCPSGGNAGPPSLGLSGSYFNIGLATVLNKGNVCIAIGPFVSPSPFIVSGPIADF
jgi:RHS repeat-associated protein